MPYLPEPIGTRRPELSGKSVRYQRRVEDEVYRYEVWNVGKLSMEVSDASCSEAAARFCLDRELSLLEFGRSRAGTDPLACALVQRKLNDFANRNDRRLNGRWS